MLVDGAGAAWSRLFWLEPESAPGPRTSGAGAAQKSGGSATLITHQMHGGYKEMESDSWYISGLCNVLQYMYVREKTVDSKSTKYLDKNRGFSLYQ